MNSILGGLVNSNKVPEIDYDAQQTMQQLANQQAHTTRSVAGQQLANMQQGYCGSLAGMQNIVHYRTNPIGFKTQPINPINWKRIFYCIALFAPVISAIILWTL